MLRRHIESVSDATYKFPSLFTLQAGQVVTVGSGFVKLAQSSVLTMLGGNRDSCNKKNQPEVSEELKTPMLYGEGD